MGPCVECRLLYKTTEESLERGCALSVYTHWKMVRRPVLANMLDSRKATTRLAVTPRIRQELNELELYAKTRWFRNGAHVASAEIQYNNPIKTVTGREAFWRGLGLLRRVNLAELCSA